MKHLLLIILTTLTNVSFASFPINENMKNEVLNTQLQAIDPDDFNFFAFFLYLLVLFTIIFLPLYLTRFSRKKRQLRWILYGCILLIPIIFILWIIIFGSDYIGGAFA